MGSGDLIALCRRCQRLHQRHQTNPSIPVSNIVAEITLLAGHGATSFIIPNLPLLGETRYPGTANESVFNGYTISFNSQLATALDGLQSRLGIQIDQFDLLSLTNRILANPSSYEFHQLDRTGLAGARWRGRARASRSRNPDQYVFWDDIHPTRVTHQIIGQAAASLVVRHLPPSHRRRSGCSSSLAVGRRATRGPDLRRAVET